MERVSNEQVIVDYANDIDTEKCAPLGGSQETSVHRTLQQALRASASLPVTSRERSVFGPYMDQAVCILNGKSTA